MYCDIHFVCFFCVQGVCCQDKQHCCPKGMTCNLGHGTCEWNGHTRTYTALPVFQPTPTGKASSNDDINCPDKKSTCPSGTTCCQMQSGWYGCCPMLNVSLYWLNCSLWDIFLNSKQWRQMCNTSLHVMAVTIYCKSGNFHVFRFSQICFFRSLHKI